MPDPPGARETEPTDEERAPQPRIDRVSGVPFCSESCQHHDGKRCRLMGLRPDGICEPAVIDLVEALTAARREERERWGAVVEEMLELIAEYEGQWGGDHLAHKWGLKEQRASIRERVQQLRESPSG